MHAAYLLIISNSRRLEFAVTCCHLLPLVIIYLVCRLHAVVLTLYNTEVTGCTIYFSVQ
jgi:hypothetical protein